MKIEDYNAEREKQKKINLELLASGVDFIDIDQAYIDENVEIGAGTVIYPCVVIKGKSRIGGNCHIGQNSRIEDSKIGDGVIIESSVILKSEVGDETTIGPFAYLRPDSSVGKKCKIGDFVEIKNSVFGDGSKASHLTYVGDSDVGSDVNLGCGVVFVNYDGSKKYRSTVGDGAFIGCNVNLISPVEVGEQAYIAAGSTVVEDVPGGSLHVARAKGRTLHGWVSRKGIRIDAKTGTYCREEGSVAAPTAGLHFTEDLLAKAEEKGVKCVYLTLHVGIGTFRPVKCDNIKDHHMHFEQYCVSGKAACTINETILAGGRIVTVGTTSARTLESAAYMDEASGKYLIACGSGSTDIFIYPGYKFRIVDALITNFHLPESTLIMLVSALYNREHILGAYNEAVRQKYRFFSYGDAMLIK